MGGRGREDRQLWPSVLIFASWAPIVFLCFSPAPPYHQFPHFLHFALLRFHQAEAGAYRGPGHVLGSGLCVPGVVGAPGVVCGSQDGNCFSQFGTLALCVGRSDFSRHSALQRTLGSPLCKSRVRVGMGGGF